MVRDYETFMLLSTVANSSFGTTGVQPLRTATQSIKFTVIDEHTLKVSYMTTVTFASDSMLRDLKLKYKRDALSIVDASLKKFSESYKEMVEQRFPEDKPEKTTVKLSLRDSTVDDSVEFTSYTIYRPRQQGIYRVSALIDVK